MFYFYDLDDILQSFLYFLYDKLLLLIDLYKPLVLHIRFLFKLFNVSICFTCREMYKFLVCGRAGRPKSS